MNIINIAGYKLNANVLIAARQSSYSYFADDEAMAPFDWFFKNHDVISEREIVDYAMEDMEMLSQGDGLQMWNYILKYNNDTTSKILGKYLFVQKKQLHGLLRKKKKDYVRNHVLDENLREKEAKEEREREITD